MTGVSGALRAFTTRDLVVIAVLAALGIAVKPIVVPLAHLVAAPLLIPGGALAGGIYMMWLVVGMGIVGKRGTATLIALVQALLVMLTGVVGSHGALSLISYTMPGIVMDLGLWLTGHRACCLRCCFLAGILANLTGTLMVNLIFFRLPPVPLALTLCTAALSGGVGGVLAWQVIKALRRYHIGVGAAGKAATGVTLLAVSALSTALILSTSACSAGTAAPGAADSQGRAPVVFVVRAAAGINATLPLAEVFSGAHAGAASLPLGEALAAAAGASPQAAGDPTAQVAVYFADGSVRRLTAAACALTPAGGLLVRGSDAGRVTGVVVDPPAATVSDVRRIAQKNLAAGGRTLIVYLDGFGWDQYVEGKRAGRTPAMAKLPARRALTVFPTITPVTFAAMVSGEDPSVTGVHDRSVHRLACPTVFSWAERRGLSTSLIDGDLQVLALTRNAVFNVDEDGDGSTDGEVFSAARQRLEQGQPDFMLVHLHGIDDVATADGPSSAATARTVAAEDEMVAALLRLWHGQVIVVADHGLHAVKDAAPGESRGRHGDFRSEDLLIPILVRAR